MSLPRVTSMAFFLPCCFWLATTCSAQDDALKEKINIAIDKGVEVIKKTQAKDGHWVWNIEGAEDKAGLAALCGWTLLEAGVPAKDDAVANAAEFVRKEALSLFHAYGAATVIFFLDRLGDPTDVPLIEAAAAQLLAAQRSGGGWGYVIPGLTKKEQQLIRDRIRHLKENPPKENPPKPAKDKDEDKNKKKKPRKTSPEFTDLLLRMRTAPLSNIEDNSNTQFAMMALWVARRHGIPVDNALSHVARRFRDTQLADGTWGYKVAPKKPGIFVDPKYTKGAPAFTCAGVLALALGQGVKKDAKVKELLKEPPVKSALEALVKDMDQFTKAKEKFLDPREGGKNYYFLWSLERMAVVFDMKKVGERDWYVWGAEALWDQLERKGSWRGEYGIADTCFAVLFLKRANVAQDLTDQLKLFNPIQK